MAFFKGKVVTAGGRDSSGNTMKDIHTFTPSEGWLKVADLTWNRFQLEALVLDEGTSQVKFNQNGKYRILHSIFCFEPGSFITSWWKEWGRYENR